MLNIKNDGMFKREARSVHDKIGSVVLICFSLHNISLILVNKIYEKGFICLFKSVQTQKQESNGLSNKKMGLGIEDPNFSRLGSYLVISAATFTIVAEYGLPSFQLNKTERKDALCKD